MGVLIANQKSFSETRAALSVDLRPRLDFLYLSGDYELEKAGTDFDINKEIKFLIEEIKREHYKEILQKIGQEIKKCEAEEGPNLNKLTEEFKNISKKLYGLNQYEEEKNKKISAKGGSASGGKTRKRVIKRVRPKKKSEAQNESQPKRTAF